MPLKRCQKDGEPGWKFGEGTCFTGARAKDRAIAQAVAINASRRARGEPEETISEEKRAQEAGEFVSGLTEDELDRLLAQSAPEIMELGVGETDEFPEWVKKADPDKQLVWGEVYVPDQLDSHGDFMTEPQIEAMAHRFLAGGETRRVDVQHDQELRPCAVVESFIAGPKDPEFIPGSWVICMKVNDPVIWADIKEGRLNGFSMEALVIYKESVIELEVPEEIVGTTEPGGENQHTHGFKVRFDLKTGDFLGGHTSLDRGTDTEPGDHIHRIEGGSVTGPAIPAGAQDPVRGTHTHRYAHLDALFGRDVVTQDTVVV